MFARIVCQALYGLLLIPIVNTVVAAGTPDAAPQAVPVTEEPLHVVKYRDDHFLIYTNWIEPGIWTLYHEHENNLLAVIVADTVAASQAAGGATVAVPRGGRGLLLAPLAPATFQLANEVWTASLGEFRLYTDNRPEQLQNAADTDVTLVVFDAC